ncbi:MAG: WD40/YVTN/BNR-like repeat-containing protein [Gemmatimonadales bacterium]
MYSSVAARRWAAVALAAAALAAPARAQTPAVTSAPVATLFRDFRWRNIGPANMAGRVTDIEASEANPSLVYVAAASGGVWKSVNAGTTWDPIFTRYGTANVGDLAVFQGNPDVIWVGTGEACVRNSVGWGDGVYKSTDGGKTFTNVGLKESHHIGRVVTHPTNPDVAYVAAQGHLWDHGGDQGVFRTTDGGRTWRRLTRGLPDDGRTGATDLVIDPSNPNVLYAGFWERLREPHRFTSGGPNGGIFKSIDGGESWTRLTSGLPSGPTGKIGLSVYRKDPRILVAIVEHGFQPARMVNGQPNPDFADMTRLGSGIYRSEDGGASWQFINRFNNRPFYYSHIYLDPGNASRVFVLATNAQVSEDGGRSFSRSLQGISGDFHALWVDPKNSDRFYVGNDKGAYATYDGGRRFIMFDNMDIGQFYAVTVDNRDPYWVYGGLQDNGNWGGPSHSRDYNGVLNDHWFKFHAGDGFHTTVDPNDWRTVYTEAQGGRIRRFDAVFRQMGTDITPNRSNVLNLSAWLPDSARPPAGGGGGGGGFGGGGLPRSRFRFNWSSPIVLSPHDSRIVWFGGNHLFRSADRGDTWTIVGPDLSTADTALANPESGGLTRDVTGAETHATIFTIAESPLVPGLVWAGTDDGNIQLTRDGGRTWTNVRPNLRGIPPRTWVSRVEASRFDAGSAYVVFDGHRRGDMKPYVFKTADYGRTWTSLVANLPATTPVYVVREDLRSPRLLYAGTETGVLASIDAGRSWQTLGEGLPVVPVYDLVLHPREGDLVAATHGRSVWILDDLGPLQQVGDEVLASDGHLFGNKVATRWRGVSRGAERGHLLFQGKNPLTVRQMAPGNSPSELVSSGTIDFYLRSVPAGKAKLEIAEIGGAGRRFTTELEAKQGINRYFWPLRFDLPPAQVAQGGGGGPVGGGGGGGAGGDEGGPPQGFGVRLGAPAGPGTYRVRLTVDGRTLEGSLTVREDPALVP